ncbi:hypothetical protein MLD38_014391 [Melastoma candidum]|uniref:Uncharacterized protein n=1 Tax=Melastoma candidum TaxID=119954 RepID=A0ACB9RGT4_9MYRT|nr:hypothetical protein MLD38_014391 [Melastoma candidum]
MVKSYSLNSATMGDMLRRVSFKLIRPYPRLLDISRAWAPDELVEVFDNITWRMGSVSRGLGLGEKLLCCSVVGIPRGSRASSSDIRARRSWQDNMWTLIGPRSSNPLVLHFVIKFIRMFIHFLFVSPTYDF